MMTRTAGTSCQIEVMPVELLRARIEFMVEKALPEYAYAKDLSVFVGRLFDLIVISDDFMLDSFNQFTELAHEMALYSDLGDGEIRELLSKCLDTAMVSLRDYRLLRNATWHWMTYMRNDIVIVVRED